MNTQIYLLLKKNGDLNPTAMGNLKDLKNFILGDALDMPFVKWIRVNGISNSIGFSSGTVRSINSTGDLVEKDYGSSATIHDPTANPFGDSTGSGTLTDTFDNPNSPNLKHAYSQHSGISNSGKKGTIRARGNVGRIIKKTERQSGNQTFRMPRDGVDFESDFFTRFQNDKLQAKLPDHDSLTFVKNCDNATPQLAFAASAQEPVKHALFAFRRKIGNGVQGIRVPFLIVWLRECKVAGWELNGDVETVKLKYKTIKWCSYDQVSDWNMPTGMSNRDWDTQDQSGGEDLMTYAIMAALAAATVALGLGLSMGLTPLSSTYTAGDRTKTLKLIE
ncbi:type VI secretion system tube protein Hcp [uncultured Rubinisphaera sp.]|mgnify:CR=1 FL=1|uniref:type VI secretion system tube protein Hcp n=1 Tax=uncultured Rubinisphaera sp. TaxID=1678686 RepID=UPI0030DC691E